MIKAIFYSKFDTQEGPKVVHQVPDGAIVPSATAPSQPLFLTFSDISFFVIPRQELCGNLIQVCTNGYRILGYPICMKSLRYDRNEFIFNFCVVLAEEEDFSTYKSVVQKLADLMHGLEEQNGFLSRDHSKSGEGKVYSLFHCVSTQTQDANWDIPDELNTLNIKLFPIYPAPPPVKAWHVPLFTVRYQTFMDENWDLTMQRIVPHINGVNSVRIISILADTDFSLTCRAIRHLLYYGCLFLLDIFSFSAIYAPTAQFSSTIATDEEMQQETASPAPGTATDDDTATTTDIHPTEPQLVDGVGIVELYASLKQGQSIKQWYLQHSRQLAHIDIRRFITFGVIKGFIYRVHKYAVATGNPAPPMKSSHYHHHSSPALHPPSGPSSRGPGTGTNSPYATSAGDDPAPIAQHDGGPSHHSTSVYSGSRPATIVTLEGEEEEDDIDDKTLSKYLDGMHCFDQICTELEISERELTARLKRFPGEVLILHR
ncbi:uncharacterized protein An01g03520 [Aspergillus niger]|uniref:Contig An01c0110, genomic contig n=2 Tax=Aspergillus niger TaxID=5061 RepID=A2Q893_ASPNC|nr:uncharacterized protein An01g03520 [Aspergillus niger]CAK36890.1 unnamed protein product [Aspergillus niger]